MTDEARRLLDLLNDGKTRWCAGCKERQDEIDRLQEENWRLAAALYRISGQLENVEAALNIARRETEEALEDGDV